MNSKVIGMIIGIVVLGGLVAFNVSTTAPANDTENRPATANVATTTSDATAATQPATTGYTSAQVGMHADKASCWSIVSGKVYDLTAWIAQHPGGSGAILSICGKDGTSTFEGQHGGDVEPEQILASFYIGTLIQ